MIYSHEVQIHVLKKELTTSALRFLKKESGLEQLRSLISLV